MKRNYNEVNFCKSVKQCTSTSIGELSHRVKTNSNETGKISAELSALIKETSFSTQESTLNTQRISNMSNTIDELDNTLTSLIKNDEHLDQEIKDAISTLDNLRGTVTNMTSSINERKYQNTLSSYSLIIGSLACMLLIFAYLLKRNKAGNTNTQNETITPNSEQSPAHTATQPNDESNSTGSQSETIDFNLDEVRIRIDNDFKQYQQKSSPGDGGEEKHDTQALLGNSARATSAYKAMPHHILKGTALLTKTWSGLWKGANNRAGNNDTRESFLTLGDAV